MTRLTHIALSRKLLETLLLLPLVVRVTPITLLPGLSVCAPRKWRFFKGPMNLVDVLAIMPFFLSLLLAGLEDVLIIGKAGKIIRLIRYETQSTIELEIGCMVHMFHDFVQ